MTTDDVHFIAELLHLLERYNGKVSDENMAFSMCTIAGGLLKNLRPHEHQNSVMGECQRAVIVPCFQNDIAEKITT